MKNLLSDAPASLWERAQRVHQHAAEFGDDPDFSRRLVDYATELERQARALEQSASSNRTASHPR